jgi:hypothetical protein
MHCGSYFAILLSYWPWILLYCVYIQICFFFHYCVKAYHTARATVRNYFPYFSCTVPLCRDNVLNAVRFFIYRHLYFIWQATRFMKSDKTEFGVVQCKVGIILGRHIVQNYIRTWFVFVICGGLLAVTHGWPDTSCNLRVCGLTVCSLRKGLVYIHVNGKALPLQAWAGLEGE